MADKSNSKPLEYLDAKLTRRMIYKSIQLQNEVLALQETIYQGFLYNQILTVVEKFYEIGKVVEIREFFNGYINRSFGVTVEKDGEHKLWFVRKYAKNKDKSEMLLEHNLLIHARDNGFPFGASPILGKNGLTYQTLMQEVDGIELPYYFSVYNFLEGEDLYNWVENELPPIAYLSVADVIARFHGSVSNFDAQGWKRNEAPILELIPKLPEVFAGYVKGTEEAGVRNVYTAYFARVLPELQAICKSFSLPPDDVAALPINPIQCDFHPGNVKYAPDGRAVGIFDFDWAKVDIRVFELGLGCVYFFASWLTESDGLLYLDRLRDFLAAYDESMAVHGGSLGPLNDAEIRALPNMLVAGNLYLVLWCSRAYFEDMSLNPYEYLFYMQHQIRCLHWTLEHMDEIRKAVEDHARPASRQ